MGAYRALAQLSYQAFQKGAKTTAAGLARVLERTWDQGEWHSTSDNSGAVLRVDRFDEVPLGARLLSSISALHFGQFGIGNVGDLPIRVVWLGLGLVPGALFFTALLSWWNPCHTTELRGVIRVWLRRYEV